MKTPERWELRLCESAYPEQLAQSPRPPEVLYGIGDPSALVPGFGVVGARKATPYGRSVAARFAGWAAERGVVVVSGAAMGCDQAGQRAAIERGGKSVAVLGCGADVDYPSGAQGLLDTLRGGRGAVVSELPWGTPPLRWAFRERNRIIAGLASCLLVVEAALPSGTFSTADYALEAGRDVLAIPGSIFAPECRGPNRLIRQGATAITDVSELAQALTDAGLPLMGVTDFAPAERAHRDPVLRALVANPMRPDDIVREFDLEIVDVMRRLVRWEGEGLLGRYPDGRYGAR